MLLRVSANPGWPGYPWNLKPLRRLQEVAELVHKDFAEHLKFARIWGTGVHDGTVVKGDHVMHDKDVVELHM